MLTAPMTGELLFGLSCWHRPTKFYNFMSHWVNGKASVLDSMINLPSVVLVNHTQAKQDPTSHNNKGSHQSILKPKLVTINH